MTNTVDYLPIANGTGANVESQAQYVTDLGSGGSLQNGYQSGLAKSIQVNKTLRQSSMMTAALANFICNQLNENVLDDGNLANLITLLTQALPPPVMGARKNLLIVNDATTPDTIIDITADELVVENGSGGCIKLSNVNVNINYGTTGAGGLDTGTIAASAGYHHWLIYNPTTKTAAGLGSLSATAPTLPAGYTFKARVGWNHTDSSTKFYRVRQVNKRAQYVVTPSTNTAAMPLAVSGVTGTWSLTTAPTWAAISTVSLCPPTAQSIVLVLQNAYGNGVTAQGGICPNSNYSGPNTMNPPPGYVGNGGSQGVGIVVIMQLESANFYAAGNATGFGVSCLGWEDNL